MKQGLFLHTSSLILHYSKFILMATSLGTNANLFTIPVYATCYFDLLRLVIYLMQNYLDFERLKDE